MTTCYRLGTNRRILIYSIIGFFIVLPSSLMIGGLVSSDESLLGAGLITGCIMAPFVIFLGFFLWYTKMVITKEGAEIRGTLGFKPLFIPWSDIERIRVMHGSEAFILNKPLETKSASSMANWSGVYIRGVPYYDDEQREIINQYRYVPIDAFGWWFKHGDLTAKITEFAPSLTQNFESERAKAFENSARDRKIIKIVFGITALFLAAAVYAGIYEPSFLESESFITYEGIVSAIFRYVICGVLVLTGGVNIISSYRFLRAKKLLLATFWLVAASIQWLLAIVVISTKSQ